MGEKRRLRLVDANQAWPDGAPAGVTGEDVLRDGARVMAEYFTRRLGEMREGDPLRGEIQYLADQHRDLAERAALS